MNIPFVVYDGYFQETHGICNLTINNYNGGQQVGKYLKRMGHKRVLCISDNFTYLDMERMEGCAAAMGEGCVQFLRYLIFMHLNFCIICRSGEYAYQRIFPLWGLTIVRFVHIAVRL